MKDFDKKEAYKLELDAIGWDQDCIWSALHGYETGCKQSVIDIISFLRSEGILVIADKIEKKFLK